MMMRLARGGQSAIASRTNMSSQPAIADEDIVDGLDVRYLKFFGLLSVINAQRTTGKKNYIAKLQYAATFFLNVPVIIVQCLGHFMIEVDLQKIAVMDSVALPCLQTTIRHCIFWLRLSSQCNLFGLIRKDFLTTIPEYKQEKAKNIYKAYSRTTNFFCTTILITNILVIILWAGFPCISVEYMEHHIGELDAVKVGPYKILGAWYPLPMGETPYFELILVYELFVLIWNVTFLAVFACLFFQPLMCLTAHFAVLGMHISTLKTDYQHIGRNEKREDSATYKELYAILQDHRKLISYAEELRQVYNPMVTISLGVGIVMQIICIVQYLFGGTTSFIYLFKFFEFLGYVGVEVSMFCYGSSALETASSDLQFAIYSSEWYKADIKFRNTAQMVMVRASKGLTLTAIKMYPVNLETMMSIFQFTYSASALMSRMVE